MRVRAWYLVYNLVLHAGVALCAPFWLFRRFVRGRYRGQYRERIGRLDHATMARFGERPAIWVHAASAGETASAAPLVRALRARYPDHPFLFTVTSRYGKEMAAKRLEGLVDAVCYSPFDLPWFVGRYLDKVRPCAYVMVETDFWPNVVRKAARRGAVVALASGHAGSRHFPRSFWRAAFGHVALFCMQTESDAKNIIRRGAAKARVEVLGNLKFDGSISPLPDHEIPAWRAELGFPEGVPVLVAGSTLAEDEGPVLDAITTLRREGIDVHAVLAPRRQERVLDVVKACAGRGICAVRRTEGGRAPVLILDTMGELARSYHVADAAYIGGGLTPDVGLHNLLEPLGCGVPVLFGPHRGKAWRIVEEVLRSDAGVEVADGAGLTPALRRVLTDPAERERLAWAGQAMLARHQGAAERQAERIARKIAEKAAEITG